jgi:hypothetical protein
MRRVGDQRHHVRHDRHTQSSRIGEHHGDRLLVFNGDIHIVCVGQSDFDFSAGDQIPDDRVAVDHTDAIRLQPAEEVVHLLVAGHRVEGSHVKRGRPESWIGNRDLVAPLGISEVEYRTWGFLCFDQLGVVRDHPDPGREACPIAFRIHESRRDTLGAR